MVTLCHSTKRSDLISSRLVIFRGARTGGLSSTASLRPCRPYAIIGPIVSLQTHNTHPVRPTTHFFQTHDTHSFRPTAHILSPMYSRLHTGTDRSACFWRCLQLRPEIDVCVFRGLWPGGGGNDVLCLPGRPSLAGRQINRLPRF